MKNIIALILFLLIQNTIQSAVTFINPLYDPQAKPCFAFINPFYEKESGFEPIDMPDPACLCRKNLAEIIKPTVLKPEKKKSLLFRLLRTLRFKKK